MSELSYRVVGEGPPLLLLHGFGISYKIWQALIPLLKSHFQLILVELPGIGASPPVRPGELYYAASADRLDALRRKLGLARWSILCYSTGTRVGEAYLKHYRHAVNRCVFLCPLHVRGWRWYALQGLVRMDAMLPAVGHMVLSGASLSILVLILGFNGRFGPQVAEWTTEIGAQPVSVLKQILRDIPDEGSALLDPGVPSLHIWGRQDLITAPPSDLGDAHFYIDANHAAPVLAATDVADLAINFLKQ